MYQQCLSISITSSNRTSFEPKIEKAQKIQNMAKKLSIDDFFKIEEGISLEQLQEIKLAFQVKLLPFLTGERSGTVFEIFGSARLGPSQKNFYPKSTRRN